MRSIKIGETGIMKTDEIRTAALRVIRAVLEKPVRAKKDARRDWLAPPPLDQFRNMEPLGFGLPEEEDWWIFNPSECKPDLVWPLNVGFVTDSQDELVLSRFYTVTPKQTRGYAHRFGPFMVRNDHGQVVDRGELATCAGLFVWLGGRWVDAQDRVIYNETSIPGRHGSLPKDECERPAMATSLALRQRYQWAVSLGLENSPSVRFATDPTGIKDAFRIRDLPEGRDRRDALLTWVSDHWRRDRSDPDVELYVRKHLRGATSFSWRGMNCELLPSQFDLEQRERFLAERLSMKAAGKTVRERQAGSV
jgi:hypothetical protein